MRGFIQISPTNLNEKNATTHSFIQGINTFQLNHFGASKVKELIRSDTLAKCLT